MVELSSFSDDEEGFLLSNIEVDLFEEDTQLRDVRSRKVEEYQKRIKDRPWGLAHRDRCWGHHASRKGVLTLKEDKQLHFREEPGQQRRVWDCSLVLAKFLCHPMYFSQDYFQNKSVIELGCGIGVPGMTASMLGANEVLLTDLEDAVEWININMEMNRISLSDNIRALALNWEDSENDLFQQQAQFDVILCSDLVYGDHHTSHALVKAIQLVSHDKTVLISAHENRLVGDHGATFYSFMSKLGFQRSAVPYHELDATYRSENIPVCIWHRTNVHILRG